MSLRVLTALPVYNEEQTLLNVINEVRHFCPDVLVVDDGSTDRTPLLLAECEGVAVVRHRVNQGYGAALRSAFEYALEHGYDVLVTIDCDGQHQPRLIPELAAQVYAGDEPWDIVSGSRYLQDFADNSRPPEERRRINMELTRQLNECFGLNLTDSFCGFKAYRVDALSCFEITELGYAMPLQFWVQAVGHNLRITEFPVPLVYLDENRTFGGTLDDAQHRLAYYRQVLRREMDAQQVPCGGWRK